MNRPCRRVILTPLLAVVAMLLGVMGTASAAFNPAATEAPLGNFLLWEYEASLSIPLELADPSKEIGVWVYDDALGVPVYVRQNPWSAFDPLGLELNKLGPHIPGTDVPDNPDSYTKFQKQTPTQYDVEIHSSQAGFEEWVQYQSTATLRKDGDRVVIVNDDGVIDVTKEYNEISPSQRKQQDKNLAAGRTANSWDPRAKLAYDQATEFGDTEGAARIIKHMGEYKSISPEALAEQVWADKDYQRRVEENGGSPVTVWLNGCNCGKGFSGREAPAKQFADRLAKLAESGTRVMAPVGYQSWRGAGQAGGKPKREVYKDFDYQTFKGNGLIKDGYKPHSGRYP